MRTAGETATPEVSSTIQRARNHSRLLEWGALAGGIVAIVAAISPPFDAIADRSLSIHMLQHLVLINIGAPLLAIAWPLLLGRWQSLRAVAGLNVLARPAPALLLPTVTLWIWHVPLVYDSALEHDAVHAFEHFSFVVAFVLFWRPLVNDPVNPGHLKSNGSRVFYLSAGMLSMGLLGALITFDNHLIYTFYATSTFTGRSPLADQHLGGAIMLLFGTVVVVIAALVTIREER